MSARLKYLDKIAKELEEQILTGRGNIKAMKEEWRACQDEMRRIEKENQCRAEALEVEDE